MKHIPSDWSALISPKRWLQREVRRANHARDRGEWKIAAKYYLRALRVTPDDARLWMQAGHACKEGGNLDGARAAYAQAEKLAPSDIDTQIQLGHFYKLLGQDDRAMQHYQAAVDGGSADEHALHFLATGGLARVKPGDYQDTRLDKADAARDAGMFERAAQLYNEAVQVDPRGPTFVQLGNCLKEAGSLLAAEKAYTSALELSPSDADCLLQLGHLMKVMGDTGRAEIYFEQSARLDSDRPDAAAELSALRVGLPEPEASGPATVAFPSALRAQVVAGMVTAVLQNIRFAQTQRRY